MKLISTIKAKNWLAWLITLFLFCFLIVIHVRLYQYAFDDAYIHFRVARNFFENGSPYYNTGEIVKVSTSSGWIVFLTILFGIARLFRIDNNFPLLISIINALITFSGMLVFTKVGEILLNKQLSLSMKMLFQIPYIVFLLPSSIGLMETPFALLITGLGICFLLQSKPFGFALLGIAAYIRLELLILLALTSLFIYIRKQYRLLIIIGYIAIGSLPFFIFDYYFFHTALPHSIVAKSIVYSIAWFIPAANMLFNSLPQSPLNNSFVGITFISTIIISVVLITTIAAIKEQKENNIFWPILFCAWGFLVVGGYIIGHTLIVEWYKPLYTIPFLIACFLCSFTIDQPRKIIIRSLLIVICMVSIGSMTRIFYSSLFNPGAFDLFETESRVKVYLKIGSILNDEYPNATLLTSEIGGLGYSFQGRILDAAGLASPAALEYHPMKVPEERASGNIGAIPPGYVKQYSPDLIVSYDYFAQALLNNEIIHQYNVILIPAFLPEDAIYSESKTIWGSRFVRIYIRKDIPISERIYALGQ
jgi:hypothetical protein